MNTVPNEVLFGSLLLTPLIRKVLCIKTVLISSLGDGGNATSSASAALEHITKIAADGNNFRATSLRTHRDDEQPSVMSNPPCALANLDY